MGEQFGHLGHHTGVLLKNRVDFVSIFVPSKLGQYKQGLATLANPLLLVHFSTPNRVFFCQKRAKMRGKYGRNTRHFDVQSFHGVNEFIEALCLGFRVKHPAIIIEVLLGRIYEAALKMAH